MEFITNTWMPGHWLEGLHAACGTGVCLASPPGERAATDQWCSLERMNEAVDVLGEFYWASEGKPTEGQSVILATPACMLQLGSVIQIGASVR